MNIQAFTFNPFQENTYLVSADDGSAVIIDPGCYDRNERHILSREIESRGLQVKAILNTHAHIDHVLGNAWAVQTYQAPLYLHPADLPTLNAVPNYAHLYGFEAYEPSPQPDELLEDRQILQFGSLQFEVIFGPGHAPGHVAFHSPEHLVLIGGDILFQGSFGRVDLPGGDINILKKTIHERMFTLPEETIVYPGHGPATRIGIEKRSNYILEF